MVVGKASLLALIIGLVILIAEFFLVFNGSLNPGQAVIGMVLTLVNGLVIGFAVLAVIISLLLIFSDKK